MPNFPPGKSAQPRETDPSWALQIFCPVFASRAKNEPFSAPTYSAVAGVPLIGTFVATSGSASIAAPRFAHHSQRSEDALDADSVVSLALQLLLDSPSPNVDQSL